jgi:hypothetical protein
MERFEGQLWLVPEYANELNVEILLEEERIRIFSGRTTIGDWRLDEVDMELRNGHIFMRVEGEELIFSSLDPGFAPALIGEELDESDEPYIPYEPPAKRGRHRRGKRRRRRSPLRYLFSRR